MKDNIFLSMLFLLSFLPFIGNYINEAASAVPCITVEAKAAGYVGFAMGKDTMPSPACCSGLQQLAQMVKPIDDKKAIGRCLKGAVTG
ncbi:non-specific lipid-transfer protein D, cotyledon-specific isoform-like [Tripterygium wilfordii]|uniref:non-specific lipid-transfer protein D, cotyledon-specific isoform-like n=1 Tax=Tripterygium wilfordii TaxID=458696 RepID=UPI0018F8025E|nr:non-specific lipid-transfer protein D, cotyledon-specific isoform-like [Tripterygium wilfordii]